MVADYILSILRHPELRTEAISFAVEIAARLRASRPAEDPTLLTAAEVARRLGVSVAHVRRLDPPHVIVGDKATKRYDLATVRAWLAEREPKATTPAARPKADDVNVGPSLAKAGLRGPR